MNTFAAVMTGKGVGAISTIQLHGESAKAVLNRVFTPTGKTSPALAPGQILLGTISNAGETIDQVTIGCEGPNSFAINCHGNPIIVETIMRLLKKHDVTLLATRQLRYKILSAEKHANTIELEARLTVPEALTLEGTKIIVNQIRTGLAKTATQWLENTDEMSLDDIKIAAKRILRDSDTARLIIRGCTAVIAGPPNSGKSTLLNCLAGKQKAIVTDIEGTTRDWVSARCRVGPLSVKFIDTAGLSGQLTDTVDSDVEKASQQKTAEILEKADLLLLVLDAGRPGEQLDAKLLERLTDKKTLTVLNKSDLPIAFDIDELPETLAETVQISAKNSAGIDTLLQRIQQLCGVLDLDFQRTVAFTERQQNLLRRLLEAKSTNNAHSIITELLNGPISV